MNRILAAQTLAHEAHDSIGQKRKYTGEPYWNHTDAVAEIVTRAIRDEQGIKDNEPLDISEENMVCAAHLHDVIEDVFPNKPYYDINLIARMFGNEVAGYVVDLTDVYTKEAYPEFNRVNRKELERNRVGLTLPNVKTIKLADLISNTKSIVAEDPDFARTYLREKAAMLPLLKDGSKLLWERANNQLIVSCSLLNIDLANNKSSNK